MFIYFNENKCAYHKGQLAPFFIVFIVVIIIAALVTINIGKVAKTKTYSANSVDAGVLAAASIMASAFNYIAVANSHMEVNYQYFMGLATISFILGYVEMGMAIVDTVSALGMVCTPAISCGTKAVVISAIAALEEFNLIIASLIVQVTGYWMLQFFFYKMIRDNVDQYRQSAIDSGYNFAFSNSGIASKLKSCRLTDTSLCNACEDACERDCKDECGEDDYDCLDICSREELNCLINNCQSQRAEYQLWVKNNTKDVPNGAIQTYPWLDGQERSHDVATRAVIDPVDDYNLHTTALSYPAELALLIAARVLSGIAIVDLGIAKVPISCACICTSCCPAKGKCNTCPCFYACCGIAEATLALALAAEIGALTSSIAAHIGLAPLGSFHSHSDNDALPFIITWIDEVPHNRLAEVYQTQRHQGADLGAWSTEYPLTTSSSQASFAGQGDIYPPDPHHDSTLTLTDFFNGHLLGPLAEPIKDVEGEIQADLIEQKK